MEKQNMKDYVRVVFSKMMLKHVVAALVLFVVLVILLLLCMRFYTHHGEQVTVPNVQNLTLDQALPLLNERTLTYQVVDSVYNPKMKPGNIVNQTPVPNAKVKKGRTVYVTINTYNKPKVSMPDVTQVSSRSARAMVEALGLEVVREEYRPSEYNDLVLDVRRLGGDAIVPGERVEVGTGVVLVVGRSGLSDSSYVEEGEQEPGFHAQPEEKLKPRTSDIEEFF